VVVVVEGGNGRLPRHPEAVRKWLHCNKGWEGFLTRLRQGSRRLPAPAYRGADLQTGGGVILICNRAGGETTNSRGIRHELLGAGGSSDVA